jgi:hypothetical protein
MAIDLRSELRRPVSLALAGLALVGWILFLIVLVSLSQENSQARDQVVQLQTSEARLRGELETQRRASGSLADLQARITAAEQAVSQAGRAREEAQAPLLPSSRPCKPLSSARPRRPGMPMPPRSA